jgi:hypothetical protein
MPNVDFAQAMRNTAEVAQQQIAARDAIITQMKNRATNVVETYSALLQAQTGAEVFRRALEMHSAAPDYGKVQIIEIAAPDSAAVPQPAVGQNAGGSSPESSLAKRLAQAGLLGLGIAAGAGGAYIANKMMEPVAPVVSQPVNGNLREQLKKEGYDRPPAGALK